MSPVVGVFGGSFDPVHTAHVEMARRALAQTACEEIWFLPAATAVHKPAGAVATAAHRRAMLELVLADESRMKLCALELEAGRPMRSLESLQQLRELWPGHRWHFLLGEDSYRALESWYRPAELFAIAPPIVAPRPGSEAERGSAWAGHRVIWLEGEEYDLDSTAIRAALAAGDRPEGLDPRVLEYIADQGLYQEQGA